MVETSSVEVFDLVTVGLGLSLVLYVFFYLVSQSPASTPLLLIPAENPTLTVLLMVWLPILAFCLASNYKTDTVPARSE